jgi:DNA transposition AAA+ family ATPase
MSTNNRADIMSENYTGKTFTKKLYCKKAGVLLKNYNNVGTMDKTRL